MFKINKLSATRQITGDRSWKIFSQDFSRDFGSRCTRYMPRAHLRLFRLMMWTVDIVDFDVYIDNIGVEGGADRESQQFNTVSD